MHEYCPTTFTFKPEGPPSHKTKNDQNLLHLTLFFFGFFFFLLLKKVLANEELTVLVENITLSIGS